MENSVILFLNDFDDNLQPKWQHSCFWCLHCHFVISSRWLLS